MPDRYEGRESERPVWEGTGHDPGPILENLPPIPRMQVVNALNVQLIAELVELVEELGGEPKLRPGFRERIGTMSVGTRFLYEDESEHAGGSYLVWAERLTPDRNHPGLGTRWQRMEGPRRVQEWQFYEVEEADEQHVTLVPITEAGERREDKLRVTAKTDYLRRGIGWRRWTPPPAAIEELGGKR